MATLPPGNPYTLEVDNDHWVIDSSNPPAPDDRALLALLPIYAQEGDSKVRAAWLAALRKAWNYCWAQWGQLLAAEKTPRFASDVWLDYWGELLKRARSLNEDDPVYRQRLLTPIDMVTPAAIEGAVRGLTENVSLYDPLFFEPLEGTMYVADNAGTTPWTDFVQPDDVTLWRDEGGVAQPGEGPYVGPDGMMPAFWIILAEDPQIGGSYLSARIISEVEQRKAAGVAWALVVDPSILHAV